MGWAERERESEAADSVIPRCSLPEYLGTFFVCPFTLFCLCFRLHAVRTNTPRRKEESGEKRGGDSAENTEGQQAGGTLSNRPKKQTRHSSPLSFSISTRIFVFVSSTHAFSHTCALHTHWHCGCAAFAPHRRRRCCCKQCLLRVSACVCVCVCVCVCEVLEVETS